MLLSANPSTSALQSQTNSLGIIYVITHGPLRLPMARSARRAGFRETCQTLSAAITMPATMTLPAMVPANVHTLMALDVLLGGQMLQLGFKNDDATI